MAGTRNTTKGGCVLVIDDDSSALNFIAMILRKEGFDTVTAESGYAGFTVLERRAQEFDGDVRVMAIICDWKMPGWDGLKVLSEIRNRSTAHIPFILISGAVTREELENAAKNKADAVVLKPVNKDILVSKLKDIVEKSADKVAKKPES